MCEHQKKVSGPPVFDAMVCLHPMFGIKIHVEAWFRNQMTSSLSKRIRSYQISHYSAALFIPFDRRWLISYGFCINDTDLQEITKTEVGITKTEVADF